MNGKQFEKLVQLQMDREDRRGNATMSRCGVHAVFIQGKWSPIDSLPDFEGVLPGGRQFVFDAKVCSQASFPLDDDKLKKRQLRHLKKRDHYGAIAFLLIHFPERKLATRTDPELTVAFPVSDDHEFWRRVDSGEVKRLSRDEAMEFGVLVRWTDDVKTKPDLLPAVKVLEARMKAESDATSDAINPNNIIGHSALNVHFLGAKNPVVGKFPIGGAKQ